METVNGVTDVDKGGPPPPSPLTGCYLLIVVGEPHSDQHKDIILQRIAKGLLSWDLNDCLVDLEKELAIITEQALEGEEARYGERLIQFASENLVTEILIHPAVSTLAQCMRNLLSSFTRHRHIIHAGYTFAANGSWALQDGTFSSADFSEAFQELEVQRVIRAYENGISLDLHCSPEGDWNRLPKEHFAKACKVRVNPTDVLTSGSPPITEFINYISPFLLPTSLENILESSDVVGNIRFSRPTLYVFPGGQGDAALFGINGFNMLLDGGFSRKACFWDFVRHLDRLDAVLMTRLNNSNVGGISSVLRRKTQDAVYPQIGHFFCNIQERKALLSPDGDKDKDPLLINLMDEGQDIISNLRHLNLNPQVCYRDSEPINLYHKVGHGTLDMYVLSPAKDSKEVREFLQKWNQSDQKLFANSKSSREFSFPIQNLISIAALLVWQPANPNDTITRILFPGSSPQRKIFEGLDRLKNLEFIKHPVCTDKSLVPSSLVKKAAKDSIIEKVISKEKVPVEKKENKIIENNLSQNGDVKEKFVKKSDSTESERSTRIKKSEDKIIENGDKPKAKPKPSKVRSDAQQKRKTTTIEKKSSPTTPKKTVENGEVKKPTKPSPIGTPAKSTKDANNRKVIESKTRSAKPPPAEPKPKVERKPISRRPKGSMKAPISPVKKLVNGVQKPDSISKKGKLDKEGTTDSSTVSTPSADQESLLKKDISKLTPEEIQQMKAQELADLKEEQEAVKEIEAVFRKGEVQPAKDENLRKVKDISIDDKLEKEEYLIIEKEEIEHDSLDEKEPKEDETQKLARDSEESEKQRKLSAEEQIEQEQDIQDQINTIVNEAEDIVKAKEDTGAEFGKETAVISPEEKLDVSSTDKKTTDKEIEEEVKDIVESQPDEKVSANVKSGDTTTAPTLPEDERIPLDEIKEDSAHVIEEKHVKEETKEKEVPVIQLPPKTFDAVSKVPGVVGIRLDKQSHIRDIVKTPDEVADLPVHEEVDYEYSHELKAETKTNEIVAGKKEDEKMQEFIKDSEETVGYIKEQAKEIEQEKDKDEVMQEQLKDIIEDVDRTTAMQEELKTVTNAVLESEVALEKDAGKSEPAEETTSPSMKHDTLDKEAQKTDEKLQHTDLIIEKEEAEKDLQKQISKTQEEEEDYIESQELQTEDILEKAELETKEKLDVKETTDIEEPKEEKGIIEKEETEKDKLEGKEVREEKESRRETDDVKKIVEEKETPKKVIEIEKTKSEKEDAQDKLEISVKGDSQKEIVEVEELKPEKIDKQVDTMSKSKEEEKDENVEKKDSILKQSELKELVDKDKLKDEKKESKHTDEKSEHKKHESAEDKVEEHLVNGEVMEEDPEELHRKDSKAKTEDATDIYTKLYKSDDHKDMDKVGTEVKEEDKKTQGKLKEELDTEPKTKPYEKKVEDIPSVHEIKTEQIQQDKEIIKAVNEEKVQLEKIDEKLQHLKEISHESKIDIIEPKKLEDVAKTEQSELIKGTKRGKDQLEKLEEKLLELKEAEEHKSERKQGPETAEDEDEKDQKLTGGDIIEKFELGRKSPKEREEDVIKIVASVAEVLKSDAPLEEFEGKLPISTFSPYTGTYTTELRETHITTVDSPMGECKVIKLDDIPTIPEEPSIASASFLDEERKIAPVHDAKEDKRSSLLKESQELMMATSKMIYDIKSAKGEEKDEDKDDTDETGIVHRMLVTASSEDGGEEIEICPVGTITFSKSSESSGRSSPEKSQEMSKKSSIVDTISDSLSTVKQVVELHSEKDSGIDDVKSDTDVESQEKLSPEKEVVKTVAKGTESISPHDKSEEIISQTVSGKSSPDKDASIKSLASGKSTPDISDLEKSKEITSSLEDLRKPADLEVEAEDLSKEISKAESKAQKDKAKNIEANEGKVEEAEKGTKSNEVPPELPEKEVAPVHRRDSLIERIEDSIIHQFESVSDLTKSFFSKGEEKIEKATNLEHKITDIKEEGKEIVREEIEKGHETGEALEAAEESYIEQIEDKIKDAVEVVSHSLSSVFHHGEVKLEDSAISHFAEDVKESEGTVKKAAEKQEVNLEDKIKSISDAKEIDKDVAKDTTEILHAKIDETETAEKISDDLSKKSDITEVTDVRDTTTEKPDIEENKSAKVIEDRAEEILKKTETDAHTASHIDTDEVDDHKISDTMKNGEKKDTELSPIGDISEVAEDKASRTIEDGAAVKITNFKEAADKDFPKVATNGFNKEFKDDAETDKDKDTTTKKVHSPDNVSAILETVTTDTIVSTIDDIKPMKDSVDTTEEHSKSTIDTLEEKSHILEKDKKIAKDAVLEKADEIVKTAIDSLDKTPDIFEKESKDNVLDKINVTSKDVDKTQIATDITEAKEDAISAEVDKLPPSEEAAEDKTKKRKESIVEQLEDGVKSTFSALAGFGKSLFDKGEKVIEDTSSKAGHVVEDIKTTTESIVEKIEEDIKTSIATVHDFEKSLLEPDDKGIISADIKNDEKQTEVKTDSSGDLNVDDIKSKKVGDEKTDVTKAELLESPSKHLNEQEGHSVPSEVPKKTTLEDPQLSTKTKEELQESETITKVFGESILDDKQKYETAEVIPADSKVSPTEVKDDELKVIDAKTKHGTESKSPTDSSGKSTPDLKSDTKIASLDVKHDVISEIKDEGRATDKQTVGSGSSPVVSGKSSPDLKTDKNEKVPEIKGEVETIETLESDVAAKKDLKPATKEDSHKDKSQKDTKEELKSSIETEIQRKQSTTVLFEPDLHKDITSDLPHPKTVTPVSEDQLSGKDDKTTVLSGTISPELETKDTEMRKLSVSEPKEVKSPSLSGKSTPEVKVLDESVEKKESKSSESLPADTIDNVKATTEALKADTLDKEIKSTAGLSEPLKSPGVDRISESDDTSEKGISGKTSPDKDIDVKDDKMQVDLSKKDVASVGIDVTESHKETKDDDLKKSANVITDATFTTTDAKSYHSKTDKRDSIPLSDSLTRAIEDEKLLEREEKILEKSIEDRRETFEVVSDIVDKFDKCEKLSKEKETTDEKLVKQDEGSLEKPAHVDVSDITKSVVSDKSDKHPAEVETMDEKSLKKQENKLTEELDPTLDMSKSLTFDECGISTDIEEIDPKLLEKEKTDLKKSADSLKEAYDTVSELSKSLTFEKSEMAKDTIQEAEKELQARTSELKETLKKYDVVDQKHLEKEEKAISESAECLKDAYDTVTALASSLSFEQCENPEDKILQKKEKELGERADELEETFETLTDISNLVDFKKCEKPDEIDPKLIEKEEKEIEKSAGSLKEAYDTVTELSKSLSFEKCENPLDKILQKEEKELGERAEELEETFETLTDMSKSIVFEKCEQPDEIDPKLIEKEEKEIEKSAGSLKEAYDTVTELSKSLSFEKCENPLDKILHKEEKELEDRAESLKETFETVTDISNSVVFEKCEPTEDRRKSLVDDHLEKKAEDLEDAFYAVSDMSKSVIFDKCDKDEHREKSDSEKELYDEKTSKDLHVKDSVVKDLIDKVTADIDTRSISAEIRSPKDLPGTVTSELTAKASDISEVMESVTADINTMSIEAEFRKTPELLAKDNKLRKSPESVTPEASTDGTAVFEKCEKETMEKVSSELKESKREINEVVSATPLEDKEPKDLDSKEPLPPLEKEIKDEVRLLDSRLGEKEILEPKSTLDIVTPASKKLSISDVEISLADAKVSTDEASACPKDFSTKLIEAERRLSSDKKSENGDIKDDKQKTESKDTEDSCDKAKESLVSEQIPASVAGPSTLEKTKDLSEISDVAELEKQELQDTLLHEKHIPGAVTPPTVPVSPNIIESYSDDIKLTTRTEALIKEMGLRSSTPGSDDFEIVTSTQSDISSGQVSKVPFDSEKFDSDEEDQLSATSQVPHSRDSSHYDLDEDTKLGLKVDPMTTSFYGALPEDDTDEPSEKQPEPTYLYEITKAKFASGTSVDEADVKLEQVNKNKRSGEDLMSASCIGELPSSSAGDEKKDPIESWGKPLGLPAIHTYLYEITQARTTAENLQMSAIEREKKMRGGNVDYLTSSWAEPKESSSPSKDEHVDLDHINQNEQAQSVMTASFYGDSHASFADDKDPIASWGKPLGLPSPAPPTDNRGTPKKERKLPPNVTAKNKLNDDKKRSESPSKYKNKKVSPVYVDLTYVPHHGNSYYSYVDFFKRIRARYYVFSGIEPSRDVYNALLEAKQTWEDKELEVTIIPTYDTDILGYWVAENEELLTKYKIDLSPSASRCTINLQDHETSCSAYRLEF